MKRLTFTDPLGPGMPAWNAFDRAVAAYLQYNESVIDGRPKPRLLKQYYNYRGYMLRCLTASGGDTRLWLTTLDEATGRRGA